MERKHVSCSFHGISTNMNNIEFKFTYSRVKEIQWLSRVYAFKVVTLHRYRIFLFRSAWPLIFIIVSEITSYNRMVWQEKYWKEHINHVLFMVITGMQSCLVIFFNCLRCFFLLLIHRNFMK